MANDLRLSDAGKKTLATIVFTDVASFSARMNSDEEGTLRLVASDFKLMRERCDKYGGRVLKSMGDGLLMYFESASQAVACALEIQTDINNRSKESEEPNPLLHRIGIHIGDVYLNEGDVMGDGVNIASRLESKAAPGGICISQTVYDVVKNSLRLNTTFLGPVELKNIREKVPVYRLLLEAQEEQPEAAAWQSKRTLVIGGLAAVLAIAGIVGFMMTRSQPEPPPPAVTGAEDTTVAASPSPTQPAPSASPAGGSTDSQTNVAETTTSGQTASPQPAQSAPEPVSTQPSDPPENVAVVEDPEPEPAAPPPPAPPPLDKKKIFVAIFENLTGDPNEARLGSVICDTVTQGIEGTKLVSVVPATIHRSSSPGTLGGGGPSAADRSVLSQARDVEAGIAIYGSYFWKVYEVRIQAKIIDVASGEVLNSLEPVAGPLMSPRIATEELQKRVATAVSLHYSNYKYLRDVARSRPPLIEAFNAYTKGLAAFFNADFEQALASFDLATEKDPEFRSPEVRRAATLYNLGLVPQAEAAWEELLRDREDLYPRDAAYVQFCMAAAEGDTLGAYQTAQRIAELDPVYGNVINAGLRALWLNRPAEAIAVLGSVREEVNRQPLHAMAYHLRAEALHMLGRHEEAYEVATASTQQFNFNAITLLTEARALAELGRTDEVRQKIGVSFRYPAVGAFDTGRIMLDAGVALHGSGSSEAAREIFSQAIDWYEKRPDDVKSTDEHRLAYAEALYRAGRYEPAQREFRRLSQEFPEYPIALGYLGLCAARLGDTARALEVEGQLRTGEFPDAFGWQYYMRARILGVLGDAEKAASLVQNAFREEFPNTLGWTHNYLRQDQDFDSVREAPVFAALYQP